MDAGQAARFGSKTIPRLVSILVSATGVTTGGGTGFATGPTSNARPSAPPIPAGPPRRAAGVRLARATRTASAARAPVDEDITPLSSEEWALVEALGTSSVASGVTPAPSTREKAAPPPWTRTGAQSAKDALQSIVSPFGLGRTGRDAVFTVDDIVVEPVQDRERWLQVAPELLAEPRVETRAPPGEHPRAVRGRVSLATRPARAGLEGRAGVVGRSDDRSLGAFGVLRGRHRAVGFSAGVTADRFERSQASTSTSSRTRFGIAARLELGRPGRTLHATAALLLHHDRKDQTEDPITGQLRSGATQTGLLASLTTGFGTAENGALLTLGYERQKRVAAAPATTDTSDAFSLRLRGGFAATRTLRFWAQGHVSRAETDLGSRRPDDFAAGPGTWSRYEGTAAAVFAGGPLEARLALVLSHQQTEDRGTVAHTEGLPQGELRLRVTPSWTLWTHGARSLRVPGPYELAAFLTPETAAPERGSVVTLGSTVERPGFTLEVELFSAWLDHAIVSQQTPARGLGQVGLHTLGAQARVLARPTDDLSLQAIAAWNEGTTTDENASAGFLPAIRAFASIRWELGPPGAFLEIYARTRTPPWELRSTASPRFFSSTKADVRLGARGGLELGGGFSFWASVANALDRRAPDATPPWTETGVDLRLGLAFAAP